jgi:hypothetical protein
MLKLSDARNFRRTAAGLALIIGPVLLLAQSLITTVGGDDTAEYLAEVATRRGAEDASAVLGILGFALIIPGIIGALNLLRGRGVVLGHLGGTLAVLGLACFCALFASSFYDVAATAGGADTQAYVDITDSLEDRAGPIVIVAIALIGTLLGFILLGAAFIRARTVPLFAPILIIVGVIVVGPVGGESESRVLSVIANLLLLGGWGTVGLTLLRQTDEEWERPRLTTSPTARAGDAAATPPTSPAA